MNGIVLIGSGGHCASVLDSLKSNNIFDRIEIADLPESIGKEISGIEIKYTDDDLQSLYDSGIENVFITLGSHTDTCIRRKLYEKAKEIGFKFPNVIDKTAVVSGSSLLGTGVFVGKNAVINANSKIGDNVIINTGAIIEHDSYIGDFSHIAVGAVLCGNVNVGTDTFIGANSTVIQNISTGNNCVVGAGSLVRHRVCDYQKFLGGDTKKLNYVPMVA